MNVEDFLQKAMGDSQMVTNEDALNVLRRATREATNRISQEALDKLSADDAFTHMVSATASAHNALLAGKHFLATLYQQQATLWESVCDHLQQSETVQVMRQQYAAWGGLDDAPDATVAGYLPPQDNVDLDKPRRFGK